MWGTGGVMNAAWVDGTSIVSPIGVAAGGRYHYRCRHKRQPTAIHRRLEPTSTHARHHRRTHSLSLFSSPTSPSSIVFVPPSPLFLPSFAMVVALRLMRMGNKHRPVYRISVADSRRVPTGKFIEHIGTYDPHLDKMGNKMLRLNVARAKYWIAMGGQPSSIVARLLSRFHLLPVPPQRQLALVDPLVFKVLAGEDVRPELHAQGSLAQQVVDGVAIHPPTLGNRRQKELTPQRIEQLKKQAPWKLQSFPFDYQPTSSTMAAWKQARLFHQHEDALMERDFAEMADGTEEKFFQSIQEQIDAAVKQTKADRLAMRAKNGENDLDLDEDEDEDLDLDEDLNEDELAEMDEELDEDEFADIDDVEGEDAETTSDVDEFTKEELEQEVAPKATKKK